MSKKRRPFGDYYDDYDDDDLIDSGFYYESDDYDGRQDFKEDDY